ncbi:hypothetical protein ACI2IY_13120 [Lysobacter enzymogenes]|uniref:hypothetical protein n=1 Tax=Lysobacter enzymogenes TaxID=69 RepID=UPI00384DCD93
MSYLWAGIPPIAAAASAGQTVPAVMQAATDRKFIKEDVAMKRFAFGLLRARSFSHWALALAALAAPVFAQAQARPAAAVRDYVDAQSVLNGDAEVEAWYDGVRKLRDQFDEICGDTFCEGDYSNIYALRLRCSVERTSRVLGQCLWVFAASNEEVDAGSGRIAVSPKVWRCRLPLAPKTSLSALLTTLAGTQPLYAPLPGGAKSIYDGLVDCL